jgi:hypothetical protein
MIFSYLIHKKKGMRKHLLKVVKEEHEKNVFDSKLYKVNKLKNDTSVKDEIDKVGKLLEKYIRLYPEEVCDDMSLELMKFDEESGRVSSKEPGPKIVDMIYNLWRKYGGENFEYAFDFYIRLDRAFDNGDMWDSIDYGWNLGGKMIGYRVVVELNRDPK